MSRFNKYIVLLLIVVNTLISQQGIALISYNDTSCFKTLDANTEAILSANPEKYTTTQVDKLIELAACFNNLYLPTVTIKLLTDNRFKPNLKTVTEKQKVSIYLQLASAYHQNNNYDMAESNYKNAINILSATSNNKQVLSAIIKLEELLLEEKKVEKAELYITPIKKLSEGQPEDNNLWCRTLLFEAEVMKLKQNYSEAIKIHQQALGSTKHCNDTLRAHHLLELATLYTIVNKFDSSRLSLNNLRIDSLLLLSDYYLTKSGLLRKEKKLKDAAYYFRKYVEEVKKTDDYLIKNREKSLSENSAFLQLITAIQPVKKINGLNFGVAIIAIFIALIIFIVLILIILSQRKQLVKRRAELKKVEDAKEKAIQDGRLLTEKKSDGIKARLESIEKEIENKRVAINELEKQIRLTKADKKKRDKINLDLNFQIRSLLSSILGISSIYKTEFAKMREKELYKYADVVEENASRIMNIIDAYYEYTSLDSGKVSVDLKQVNAVSIIQQVVDEFTPFAKQKAVKLVFNEKRIPLVTATPTILRKIVTIATHVALQNTIKGFVIIDIDLTNKNKFCEIKVQNTGHGFDKAYVKDILEPFNREGLNYIPGFNGTGMEYPLINKLAKLIKGEVKIDAEIEQGITFTLTVQATGVFDGDVKVKSPTKKRATVPWNGLKVFVVEDDKMNRLLFTKILKEAATLVISKDGEEALETIGNLYRNDETFDIILMDINLPEPWDGVKLKDRIQELFLPYRSIPFIAQTAYAMQGDREKFLSKGFDEYISKPIIKNELIRVVDKVLSAR